MLAKPEPLDREDALSALKAFIAAGPYSPGDRLPPEHELNFRLKLARDRAEQAPNWDDYMRRTMPFTALSPKPPPTCCCCCRCSTS